MKYFLDTNVCVDILRGRSETLSQHFKKLHPSDLGLSVLTVAELRYGADCSNIPSRNHLAVDILLTPLTICPFEIEHAVRFGSLFAELRKKGQLIGTVDALIAAHALSKGVILVTNNLKEFQRVPGLICENWL